MVAGKVVLYRFRYEQVMGFTITTCEISGDGLKASATAACSPKDNFEFEKGRKLALGRAMVVAGFDKPSREDLWQHYRYSKPGGRW